MDDDYELVWIYLYLVYDCDSELFLTQDIMYVGQTVDLKKRKYEHTKLGKQLCDIYIQSKHYDYIELCCGFRADIDAMEKYLIRNLPTTYDDGYGLNVGLGGSGERKAGQKTIVQYDLLGNKIKVYRSLKQASADTSINSSKISEVISGHRRSAGGYVWTDYFKEHRDTIKVKDKWGRQRGVLQYNLNGVVINHYNSIGEASLLTGISSSSIRTAVHSEHTLKRYLWAYDDNPLKSITRSRKYPVSSKRYVFKRTNIILQYDKNGTLVKIWGNINTILKEKPSYKYNTLNKCINGTIPTAYGHKWIKQTIYTYNT